nr:uncharacterized protein LOC109177551 [Ipomoea trifida]
MKRKLFVTYARKTEHSKLDAWSSQAILTSMVIGFFGSGSGSFSTVTIIALASSINFRGGALLLDDLSSPAYEQWRDSSDPGSSELHEPAAAMDRTMTGTRPPLFPASIAAAMEELFLLSMATGVQRWPPSPISLPVQALPPPHPGNPSHPNKHIFSCTSLAAIGKLTIPATSSNFHGFRV